jgi:enolase
MIPLVKSVKAREILDSRGTPTIETRIDLDDGSFGISSVPAGTSIGKYEAVELRDNDPARYFSMGVLKAVANVNQIIAPVIIGKPARPQLTIDRMLIALDGTPNKSKLGANAVLSVSEAICKAGAVTKNVPLYSHVADLFGLDKSKLRIPTPMCNVINGGKHGAGNLDFQEFHLIPSSQKSFAEGLRMIAEIYEAVKNVLIQYKAIHSVGYEGGFAPNLFTNLDAFETLSVAIKQTPYQIKSDVYFGLDAAADHFYVNRKYLVKDRPESMSTKELIDYYQQLNEQYHLLSLEDGIDEDDWNGWRLLKDKLPDTLIVGDDLLATNKIRLKQAIAKKACSAILVKPNQIGTIAETIEVIKIARQANMKVVVSHRSGETNDSFIADFAVGVGADYVKFGAPARGERVEKYNRLMLIESEITK